ncbi:hypothetical protein ASPWEDRAFT_449825 [Aspergillus wentii DTO 134E9]|uniref:Uncharacterized protein n=1 Tax=Aspergillus wentii DTO 134E9 TaxID=1073089 RepID=A0A1L9RR53_ASPWE|nr:uncharacterized protein ASPWEDRAFT_449825 [Aspergillus wentii DTO 134E9]OJJ37353.1 hypothetical protein ASPWEDRAFT_449825 [Aspergillus wentii DTO 134E9]
MSPSRVSSVALTLHQLVQGPTEIPFISACPPYLISIDHVKKVSIPISKNLIAFGVDIVALEDFQHILETLSSSVVDFSVKGQNGYLGGRVWLCDMESKAFQRSTVRWIGFDVAMVW